VPVIRSEPANRAGDLRNVGGLLAALALVTAPHATRLPLWVFAALLGLGLWRLRREAAGESAPGRAFLAVLTAGAVAGVVATARRPIDRDAFLTLLVVLSGLKLLEMRTVRDRQVGVFLTLFLKTPRPGSAHRAHRVRALPAGNGATLGAAPGLRGLSFRALGPDVAGEHQQRGAL
jgi:hypothetical protein